MTRDEFNEMLETACAYFLGGERCSIIMEFSNYTRHRAGIPQIFLYVHALEVILKLMNYICDPDFSNKKSGRSFLKKSHNLFSLYQNLEKYNFLNIAPIREVLEKPYINLRKNIESNLSVNDFNYYWRYPYEYNGKSAFPDELRQAFIVCLHEVRQLRPDLCLRQERVGLAFAPDPNWGWQNCEISSPGNAHL